MADVMGAAYDLLRGIYADLEADVSAAEDYPEKRAAWPAEVRR